MKEETGGSQSKSWGTASDLPLPRKMQQGRRRLRDGEKAT